ncbi:MAG: choice-of-anchor D domain-containing protein [Gemmatimonadetes bacterium]|nr:choice-of-anchor D domain-containing protein [Gemmatimonadota bacterium]
MLGLDAWNGNQAQVDGFRRNGGITFPLLLNAGGAAPAQYENFVVVRPNGTALPVIGGLSSSSVTRVKDGVNELLAQIPPPAPTIAVPQTAVDFGTIDAGQTGQQTITITNTGTAPLEITGIESDVPGLTFDTTMFTLAPDSSATVTIAFPSSTAGTFSGNITISSNDPNSATQTLSVSIIVKVSSANPRADFNGDKQVNITDFLLFVEAFGSTNPKFDIDGDGAVGITDFLLFVESFGKTVDG